MAVKFFGQFLIDQGEVDASHVREALALMEGKNPTIGDLAVELGHLTRRQAIDVSAEQRNRDRAFGDLAVDLGFLSPEQLVETVRQQRSRRLPIGQALVGLGHLTGDRLGMLLDEYKADQAPYQVSERELPDGLASHGVTHYVLDLLPRFMMRVARLHAKVGAVEGFTTLPDFVEIKVSVPMRGARGLEVALVSDLAFAESLATASSGLSPSDLDPEMVADGVGEFLNVLAGNAASAITQEGHRVALGTPDYDAEVCDGWIVELAVETGHAALVLDTF